MHCSNLIYFSLSQIQKIVKIIIFKYPLKSEIIKKYKDIYLVRNWFFAMYDVSLQCVYI